MRTVKKIILIYPNADLLDVFITHAPLSLIYASVELIKNGFEVEIIDLRLHVNHWRSVLRKIINDEVFVAGISVMSDNSTKHAAEIGKFIKSINKNIIIVWGGSYATFYPRLILKNDWRCDYVISGPGAKCFFELVDLIKKDEEPNKVKGISYLKNRELIRLAPEDKIFETYKFKELPYHLIKNYSFYGQLDQNKLIFSLYSSFGCPYQCTFCSVPAESANILGNKWQPLPEKNVVDHIEYLVKNYHANYIYFIDNDSFVDLKHVDSILDEIKNRHLKLKLGFRGARISEIKKMSDEFLYKLADSGTDILHIGAESGSARMLELMHKDCTPEDIIECNQKLSRYPKITAAYNFLLLIPTETIEDLKQTRNLILRLVKDNPRCIIFAPNKYRPIPGTKLYKLAQENPPPTARIIRYFNMLFIVSYFIDDKILKTTQGKTLLYKLLRLICAFYKPIAKLRIKYEFDQFLIEYPLFNLSSKLICIFNLRKNT